MITNAYPIISNLWLPLMAVAVLSVLGLYSWQRGGVPGARPFAVVCLFSLLWLFGIAGEAVAADLPAKAAWHRFQMIWYVPTATALVCFALEYVRPGQWLTRGVLIGLTVPAVVIVALYLTNDLHHWIWRGLIVVDGMRPDYTVGGRLITLYALTLGLIQALAFGWLFVHSPQHRRLVLMMLLTVVLTRATLVIDLFQPSVTTTPGRDALVFLQAAVIYAVALFGFRIFDPVPAAYRTVVDQMQTGVLVLDEQARIVNLNPAAEQILNVRGGDARGKSWQEIAPAAAQALTSEFELGAGADARRYVPTISPLHDARGLTVGHLLSLSDVTEQRRVQAQMVEQQRALAALHERELLARELHDTVGQVLGYASLQVDTANQLVRRGQSAAAANQLARLEHVLRDAHADLRAQILNLRTTPLLDNSFLTAVRHYVDGFRDNYGISVTLNVDEELDEQIIASTAKIQLFRIMQEALANARKHAHARRIDVRFTTSDDTVCMLVEDDGCGFVPAAAGTSAKGHFGLQFMAERVHEVGGTLRIDSAPGAGTRLAVEIPRKEV